MRRGAVLAVLLLSAAVAGCLDADPGADVAPSAALAARNAWERGPLATVAETPGFAPRRSEAERTSDVVPPGATEFAAFDAVIADFMAANEVPAASVAVLRDGKLRYENGYGHLDAERTKPTPPDAMFRIASLTKPVTAAVIAMLVEQGAIAWDDPVFCLGPNTRCLLPIEPHPKRPVNDERLADLTLQDLVEHRTGWTRGPCTDPIWDGRPIEIAEEFGIPTPPPAWRVAQWFMGTPMEFPPGTDPGPTYDTYCNMGYVLLGLVAEATTGTSMAALYEAYVFRPLELSGEIETGRSLPKDRNPREPFYACDEGRTWRNVYAPNETVCAADGGFHMESAIAVGGLVSTAAAMGAIYEVFWNDGAVREDLDLVWWDGHLGGLPGTATTAWRFGEAETGLVGDVQMVVFFNKQTAHSAVEPRFAGILGVYGFQLLQA
ncbi:MAG: serine hydrolase domain-containing protein, partial [Methanobacteriota archaeon]